MARKSKPTPKSDSPRHEASRRKPADDEAEVEIEIGPDGPAPVDPQAPGKSLFDEDEDAVEPNEPG
jgi:hypothetical protein